MTELESFVPAYPEIVLAIGAMALLLLGAFREADARSSEAPGWIAILILAVAAYLVAGQGPETVRLFAGAFLVDGFGRFMKLLILGGSAVSILLSFDYLKQKRMQRFEFPVLILLATVGM